MIPADVEPCSVDAATASSSQTTQAKQPPRGRGWEVNVGALAFGSEGLALKPQCLFGAQVGNFSAEAGLHDVRDGLKVTAKAEAAMSAKATGQSIAELHENLHFDTLGFREALDAAKKLLNSKADRMAGVAETLGLTRERLESILHGNAEGTSRTPMTLVVTAEAGVGFGAHVCLGWANTKGYHMVGVGGKASIALSLSVEVFAGRHTSKRSAKILLGISNFKFEYTFPIGTEGKKCTRCNGSGKRHDGWMVSLKCPACRGTGWVSTSPAPGVADPPQEYEGASSELDGSARARVGSAPPAKLFER